MIGLVSIPSIRWTELRRMPATSSEIVILALSPPTVVVRVSVMIWILSGCSRPVPGAFC